MQEATAFLNEVVICITHTVEEDLPVWVVTTILKEKQILENQPKFNTF